MGYLFKWMVYNGKSQSKTDDLGLPPFQETSKSCCNFHCNPQSYVIADDSPGKKIMRVSRSHIARPDWARHLMDAPVAQASPQENHFPMFCYWLTPFRSSGESSYGPEKNVYLGVKIENPTIGESTSINPFSSYDL